MTTINLENKKEFPIWDILLCLSYVFFIAFLTYDVYSTEWEGLGGNGSYYYDNGPTSLNREAFFIITGLALLYVLPWLFYYLREWKKNKLNVDNNKDTFCDLFYGGFTLFLIICHFVTFLLPYYIVCENYSENVTQYIDLDLFPWRLCSFFGVLVGTIIYVPASVLVLIKNEKH